MVVARRIIDCTIELVGFYEHPPLLGAKTSAAEDENHWMLSLQFGELPAFRRVVGSS
jgi:hypothetical protein